MAYGSVNCDPSYAYDLAASKSRTATLVIAASDSSVKAKAAADYVCDGTGDQTEINNAIAALPANGGKVVLLDGKYNISGQINVNKSNVTIEGMGDGTLLNRAYNGGSIVYISKDYVTLKSFAIQGNSDSFASTANYGVQMAIGLKQFLIKELRISGEAGRGISNYKNSYCVIEDCSISNCNLGIYTDGCTFGRLSGNTITDVPNGMIFDWGCSKIIASHNTVASVSDRGISVLNSQGNRDISILSNSCIDCGTGILIAGSYNQIHGNHVIRGTGRSSDYESSQYTICINSGATNNVISDNYIPGKNYTNNGGDTNTFTDNKY